MLKNKTSIQLRRSAMTPAVREILDAEERNGAIASNVFRYVFCFLIAVASFGNIGTGSAIINISALVFYASITILHSLVLIRNRGRVWQVVFQYVSLILDMALIVGVLLYYNLVSAPENFSFFIKNPIFFYFLLPFCLTVIQFRVRPLLVALIIFLLIYYSVAFYVLSQDVPRTQYWTDYVMGPAIITFDLMTSRVFSFMAVFMAFFYTLYRSYAMVQKIAQVQDQKATLARYFSPDMVAEITDNPAALETGGRQRVTVLFLDIRGFTALSENLDPTQLALFLAEFRELMTAQIFKHGGTLDKYIGDAIMATFGTPHPSPLRGQDERNAVQAARAMLENLKAFNLKRKQSNQKEIQVGIGLHAGPVFAGNIQAGEHVEYSVLGDTVNVASRIESLCKKLEASLLISEEVLDAAGGIEQAKRMPRIKVRGRAEPIRLYKFG